MDIRQLDYEPATDWCSGDFYVLSFILIEKNQLELKPLSEDIV